MLDETKRDELEQQRGENLPRLVEIMQRLLGDGGCPWDREQTFETLRKYVLEEAYEVVDAIDRGDRQDLREELGDLLLQVVFQAELARSEGEFGPNDVVDTICDKLIRRHPHVFGDTTVDGTEDVLRNWERIKAGEHERRRILESVPRSLPALSMAQVMGKKAHSVGFDWPDKRGAMDKMSEELTEFREAVLNRSIAQQEEELGDLLFSIVNVARHLGLDAEGALRKASDKFARRFSHVEDAVIRDHGGFSNWQTEHPNETLPLETLDGYWNEAKAIEQDGDSK